MAGTPSWKKPFTEGIAKFQKNNLDGALELFTEAIRLAADNAPHTLYDSRATVYEKQSRFKDALRDAKTTIDRAPNQWHGYFRSARLFAAINKVPAALQMSSLALERLGSGANHDARRRELAALREQLEARTRKRPVSISHVCRRWREVALARPSLWHSLTLPVPGKNALVKLREWRKRAAERITELTVPKSKSDGKFFFAPMPAHPEDVATNDAIIAELGTLDRARINALYLQDVDLDMFFSAMAMRDGTYSVLETLDTLHIAYATTYPRFSRFEPNRYNAYPWPALRELSLTGSGCNWEALAERAQNLVSFECRLPPPDGVPSGTVRQFLQANSKLEKLVIEGTLGHIFSNVEGAPETLTLAHLRHLEIIGIAPRLRLTQNLNLPSLEVLRLTQLPDAQDTMQDLVNNVETSFGGLVELRLDRCSVAPRTIAQALVQAPELKTLQLAAVLGVNAIAEALTMPLKECSRFFPSVDMIPNAPDLPILCPALEALDLSGSSDLKTGPVVRTVKNRITLASSSDQGKYRLSGQSEDQHVARIQVLKLDDCAGIEAEVLPWLRRSVPTLSCQYMSKKKASWKR
ncbi:hypothetical protein BC834DRAFT_973626 [Gloeopeniophorella convolvens]|nr:hypothetical protein BC834DRAFT_973626 [Gloeopeniophorella convolvens]